MGYRVRLSKTQVQKFRLCPKKYDISYNQDIWPIGSSPSLDFGKTWAINKEAYWHGDPFVEHEYLSSDYQVIQRCMFAEYCELYPKDEYELTGTELKYVVDLNERSQLTVVFDNHTVYNGHGLLGEDKTTRQDIESDWYWEKLELDLQTGIYAWAAKEVGHKVDYVLYDVVRIPSLKQGRLGRKGITETQEDFEDRVREELAKKPDKYFQRRLHQPNVERAMDMLMDWEDAMWAAKMRNQYPRNDDSCKAYGRRCEYWGLCTGTETVEDSEYLKKGRG